MKTIPTKLLDVLIIEPDCFSDKRGWFMETYNEDKYKKIGITNNFVQKNVSLSLNKGTLRGLHFQKNPMSQAKIVQCITGKVIDVCVDLRKNSPTYKMWDAIEISSDNKRQVYIPRGFAHGFITLEDNTIFEYQVDNLYSKECDRSIRYNDESINIEWNRLLNGLEPILSDKDIYAPSLEDSDCNFIYGE